MVNEQQFEACVFQEIVGQHPIERLFDDENYLFKLGALLARMHAASVNYVARHKRENWYKERGLRHAWEAASFSQNTELRNHLQKSMEWMNSLPILSDNYSLVHADCGPSNLFVGPDGAILVIDFDDCCYHWFAFDVAFVIYSMALNSEQEKFDEREELWLEHLLLGYRSVRAFGEENEKLIPGFINFACLRILFWIEYHENLGTFRDEVLLDVKKIKDWAICRVLSKPC